MTETLSCPLEQDSFAPAEVMPRGTELRDVYTNAFTNMTPPRAYRLADDPNFADKVLQMGAPQSPYSDQRLRNEFISHAAREAYDDSWWLGVQDTLKIYAQDPNEVKDIRLAAGHSLDIEYDGRPTGQKYEVFEVGGSQDQETVQTVFDTLQLIDQSTGGALATEGDRPRIVLSDIHLQMVPGSSEEGIGFADHRAILINTAGLRAIAQERQRDLQELIAVAVVHEFLGHGLERKVHGTTGKLFREHFEYSKEFEKGELFNRIHTDIKPKDLTVGDSQPVREYGRVLPEEDLATSVDSTVATAMGWTKTTDKHPRFKSQVDPYRRDIVMNLMDEAARQASERHPSNPGFVGSEVRFVQGPDGQVRTEAARQFNIQTLHGEQAVRAEIDKMIDKQRPKADEVFIVQNDDLM